jgi:hypothetical protein
MNGEAEFWATPGPALVREIAQCPLDPGGDRSSLEAAGLTGGGRPVTLGVMSRATSAISFGNVIPS